jgi:DNA uptake protein ComE-like DNA-binding protein
MALVDVNSAPYAKLMDVPDIGKAIASQIVEGRPFKDMKDLRKRVKFIGDVREKTVSKYLCFGPHAAPTSSNCVRPSQREGRAVASQQQSRAVARQRTRGPSPTPTPSLVDINNASLKELRTLHGIKEAMALRIIDARPFYRVDDLLGVKGIKHAVLAGFRGRVVIGVYLPQQATRAAQVSPPRLPAAMTASLTRRYVNPPGPYDYSDEGETSGEDDCSGDEEEDSDSSSCKTEDTACDQAAVTGRRSADEVEVAFAAYQQELREQSDAAAVSYAEWFETQVELTPSSVPFTAVSPPDSRFPVCSAVDRDVRGFVSRSSQPIPERMPTDLRYRVCTAPEPSQRPRPILLASWNVRNVSTKKSTEFLKKIAAIINEFDLVALQVGLTSHISRLLFGRYLSLTPASRRCATKQS